MDLGSKQLLVAMVPSEGPVSACRGSISEDEAWRSYLERPLIATTKTMMNINRDEDSVATLGLLYDFYKVPKERKKVDLGSLDLVSHVQALGSMPVNLSRRHNQGYRAEADRDRGVAEDVPLALLKTDCPAYTDTARALRGMEQSYYNPSITSYLEEEEEEEGELSETYLRSPSARIQTSHSNVPMFTYNLDAGVSFRPPSGDGPMAYLNRGQFYALTLSNPSFRTSLSQQTNKGPGSLSSGEQRAGVSELPQDSVVQSIIMVVFGEEKGAEEQLKNWKYWHSRQHTAKQRVLDIADFKDSFSSIGNVEEVAYNAVSLTWDISEETKVFISVNCLSTDFSSQKGVKGTPLIIQIDTYSYNRCSTRPIHRAFTQIKVFCDKGAERKLRDEQRKHLKKRIKGKDGNSESDSAVKKNDTTLFKDMLDLDSNPVLFVPDVHFGNLQRAGQVVAYHSLDTSTASGSMRRVLCAGEDNSSPLAKKSKVEVERKVLLYVRKEGDEVFDALMLKSPTRKALMDAISEKYEVPVSRMAKVYQKSRRGLLVNMDDDLIQHLSNEDTFILTMESSADSLRVTLSEILGSEVAQ